MKPHPEREPDPSDSEIAERCQEIQATWSETERRRREGYQQLRRDPLENIKLIRLNDMAPPE